MSTTTITKTEIPASLDGRVLSRTLEEGYGPGAWHGADMRAALDDVTPELAFWRPAPGRHSIAEIALHHAYCVRSVRTQLSGKPAEAFVMEGDDWFTLNDAKGISWPAIRETVEAEQNRLAAVVAGAGKGKARLAKEGAEGFDLVLGVTCHAVYHAGQVQLLKRLHAK